ncbi:MAG: hypothetical protein M5U08_14150 [Burkholderiales bacterium]|nr:hypothetical protein [Burkholderiales bacterium]
MEKASVPIGTLGEWAGAVATFLVVLVALFKDEYLRWRRKPRLRIRIILGPPDCHRTTISAVVYKTAPTHISAACYYLRLWVDNVGRTRAERVQVYAEKLRRKSADGIFREVETFNPMNLRWAHAGSDHPEIFAEGISPRMGKHCDLGHVIDPKHRKDFGENLPDVEPDKTILSLDLEMAPATLGHLVPPGVYELQLRVAAANCLPVTHTIELTITGNWFADQAKMFSDGLGIKAAN